MAIKVKICGITSARDAQDTVAAGADALGFMFYPQSKRFITSDAAREIISGLPADVLRVGVFVNADRREVHRIIEATGINAVQFHGEESPEFCEEFRALKVWKAFRIENEDSLRTVRRFPNVDAWLLDSHVSGAHGGTGQVFDWGLAIKAKSLGRPVILAGGLHPGNVVDAVRQVQPAGIDVSSGVELAPGRKDPAKVRALIEAVKTAGIPA
ncbi:MAG TPA: phosphoribosylanthranilate isomerase [Verrucomicrobiales bacterium]|jgi:phosphoribosylanthranilate isomerase|nr:phosphoribosylanthranilate isomerase [Verrucomicrobiales bacterium]